MTRKNVTHREVSFMAWWKLFTNEMLREGLPAPGIQYSRAHYETGQSPLTALAEALSGNL